jgi:hypothetical protein
MSSLVGLEQERPVYGKNSVEQGSTPGRLPDPVPHAPLWVGPPGPKGSTVADVGRASRPEGLDRSCGRDDGRSSPRARTRSAEDGLTLRARTPDPHRGMPDPHRGMPGTRRETPGRNMWVGPPGPKGSTAPAVETTSARRNAHTPARPGTASREGRGHPPALSDKNRRRRTLPTERRRTFRSPDRHGSDVARVRWRHRRRGRSRDRTRRESLLHPGALGEIGGRRKRIR